MHDPQSWQTAHSGGALLHCAGRPLSLSYHEECIWGRHTVS